ncbi:MAG: RpiB/LacA/LacB family sugar-phosphate isomerase, partial [Clostridia bacterium]|nr:RpiB/LacA/LacB family sugar-phosphate isomerase [Clostridia bacterium]
MIILACDHAGYKLKEEIKAFFNSENISAIDVGCYSPDKVDYPDLAKAGVERVLENKQNVGIFICGTGIGMSMVANRNPQIRAALCTSKMLFFTLIQSPRPQCTPLRPCRQLPAGGAVR